MENQGPDLEQPKINATKPSLPSPFSLLKETWIIYKKRFLELSVLALPFIVAESIDHFLNFQAKSHQSIELSTLWLLVFIYIMILEFTTIAYMFMLKDDKLTIAEGFRLAAKKIIPFTGLSILYGLLLGAGFVALYIPGIYLSILYGFVPWIFILEGTSITSSFSKSKQYVKGHWWQIFGRVLFIYIVIIAPCTIIILLLTFSLHLLHIFNTIVIQDITMGVLILIFETIFMIYSYLLYKHTREICLVSQASSPGENPGAQPIT